MAIPTISTITPAAQSAGQKVTLSGTGFTGATSVKFGGYEAFFFKVVNDTIIEAYPFIEGTGVVSVTTPTGTKSATGFTLVLSRVKLTDLTDLGRPVDVGDKTYVWDGVRNILCQSPLANFPGITPTSPGAPGNIYTALGSPFKVRVGYPNYQYIPNSNPALLGSVVITDIRLLGKEDYVVSASDVSNEFENDRLIFDKVAGSVTISNYELNNNKHITIFADGIVTTEFNTYVTDLKTTINKLLKATAPFLPSLNSSGTLTAGGGIVAWFRPKNEIPAGWSEYVPGRGCILVGQTVDPTNVDPLSAQPGSAVGGDGYKLTENNIPKIQLYISTNGGMGGYADVDPNATISWSSHHNQGNQDYDFRSSGSPANIGRTSAFGKTPDVIAAIPAMLPDARIVNFIKSDIV